MNEWDEEALATRMTRELAEIEATRMPFGKYGPAKFPPRGRPIDELPAEYLGWFAQKGWPKGRLGELLRIVYQMKVDGAETAFEPMRQKRRRSL